MARLSLGLFFGGRSGEHEVSLRSARSVLSALDAEKYDVIEIGITHDGTWLSGAEALQAFESGLSWQSQGLSRQSRSQAPSGEGKSEALRPVTLLPEPGRRGLYARVEDTALELIAILDVAFPVLHGTFGEDGTIQGLFELAELPYVGAGVLASAVAMDKGLFKMLMRAHNLPVLDFVLLDTAELRHDMQRAIERAEALGPYPLFTKPANLGSSVGVSKVASRSDLLEGLMDAAQYDRRVLVERGIEAREIEVSVLGNEEPEASVPGEIVPSDIFYSYRAKYIDDRSELIIPAPLDPETTEEARRMAVEAYRAIDGAGMARVDLLLEKRTKVLYLNEVNTIPGFTQISMYPKLWEASGLPYPALLDRLVELALQRQQQKSELVRSYGEAL